MANLLIVEDDERGKATFSGIIGKVPGPFPLAPQGTPAYNEVKYIHKEA